MSEENRAARYTWTPDDVVVTPPEPAPKATRDPRATELAAKLAAKLAAARK